jgi:lipid-binding SYLF domain-containing protein
MRFMRRAITILCSLLIVAAPAFAQDKEQERLSESAAVMEEILKIPDSIPQELLDRAECVVVMPSVKKLALAFGGSYGRGTMVCRTGENFSGPWGAPAMYALEGGSFGLQLGGQATDFVFLVMNERGANSLLRSKVKLGADASAAVGPKGRTASADTDALLRAEILSYSRNRGLFAGISLEGSTLRPDNSASKKIYGRDISAREIILQNEARMPAAGARLAQILQNASPKNLSS